MSIIRKDFISESLSEDETKNVMKEINKNYNIFVDPHVMADQTLSRQKKPVAGFF